ncbi:MULTISPECIES: hypothetical protein [Streptomyces]|jgi:hypothetical protein|uniref:hypothetical protein n=1 Tax=Streptomyces TaxID=1883 RepID=UPI0029B828A8|nr:hypothetical protein [Streptomyces sp. ME02-6978.2a]MDX3361751.1 hypothetical protein [Streptomyces sp. ME02-6978.2a]
MSVQISVTGPDGASHLVGQGDCALCSSIPVVNTGYICVVGSANLCDGAWSATLVLTYQAPAGQQWGSGGNCVAAGSQLTCTLTAPSAGVFPLYHLSGSACATRSVAKADGVAPAESSDCYNLPPSNALPLLDLKAINDIKKYHYQGGSAVDGSKGLFYSSVTNTQLQQIWEAGMKDTGSWTRNAAGYYEKTFPYSGVGIQSPDFGNSLPATKVTLVVEAVNDGDGYSSVVTMYPATEKIS